MTKFIPNKTVEEKLSDNIALLKQQHRERQYNKKNCPVVSCGLIFEIAGGFFRVHKQECGVLVLKADEKLMFEHDVSMIRCLSYIVGARSSVSVADWNWRPTRYKKDKLYLKPISPIGL